jgi:hypothetical protein
MPRQIYGYDYKPPSHVARNLLLGFLAAIAAVTFVWKTYDPQTFRLLGGVQPAAAEKIQPTAEPPRIDAKQKRLPNG